MRTVLVIDDNALNRFLIREFLKGTFSIIESESPLEGLSIAKSNQPDLIILDVLMPEMSGFEVARKLKKDIQTQQIPIIFLSCLNDPTSKAEGYKAGAADYITRPISGILLRDRINRQFKST
jgi:putative two-component system response regulator